MPTVNRIKFTAKEVQSRPCKPGHKSSFYYDSEAPGLGLRVSAGGARTYIFEARTDSQKSPIRTTIGNISNWPLEEARKRAHELRRLTDLGKDPREVEKERQRQADAKAAVARRAGVTVGQAWEDYYERRVKKYAGAHHREAHENAMRLEGEPKKQGEGFRVAGPLAVFYIRTLSSLTPAELTNWLESESARRPSAVAIAFRLFRTFANWCEDQPEYAGLLNPRLFASRTVRQAVPQTKARSDCLQREQLKPFLTAVRAGPSQTMSAYIQATLLTGSRRQEMAALRWGDIDFKWKTVKLHDKNPAIGTRTIPLTNYVALLLSALPQVSEFVFASNSESGHLMEARYAINAATKAAGLPHVSTHGLRRTFKTNSEWIECPAGVVAQIMGHAPSAIAERHYTVRPISMLRMWLQRVEDWVLNEAGIELPPDPAAERTAEEAQKAHAALARLFGVQA
ncbi:putative prophage CP4-6 integrase [Paraburkholderia ribeironis]|uniref:Putative prophage CP4-6 integrase n=1 Tax=Paraburkholderia ribeironis TaxID=1247936 RepID=A0A1N7RN65_9BURK|nr:integrase family protein [Paraburkholderia ribeironis]SIT36547.1 putative prophage CP4-6 integrase [Paraburkholderia ribeironis]